MLRVRSLRPPTTRRKSVQEMKPSSSATTAPASNFTNTTTKRKSFLWVVLGLFVFRFLSLWIYDDVSLGSSSSDNMAIEETKNLTNVASTTTTNDSFHAASNRSYFHTQNDSEPEPPRLFQSLLLPLRDWETQPVINGTLSKNGPKLPPKTPLTCVRGSTAAHGAIVFPDGLCTSRRVQAAFAKTHRLVEELFLQEQAKEATIGTICDVCTIFHLFQTANLKVLTVWGDSVQNQVFHGLVCEFARFSQEFEIIEDQQLPVSGEVTGCDRFRQQMECPHHTRRVTVRHLASGYQLYLHLVFQYRPRLPHEVDLDLQPVLDAGTDVLLWNFGLHFLRSNAKDYRLRLSGVLQALKRHSSKLQLVLFRETSAQHFPVDPVKYNPVKYNQTDPTYQCIPTVPAHKLGWRDRAFAKVAQQEQYPLKTVYPWSNAVGPSSRRPLQQPNANHSSPKPLYLLPFANYSAQFDYLHPHECTHFCHTPYLWYPLWRSLPLAVEHRLG